MLSSLFSSRPVRLRGGLVVLTAAASLLLAAAPALAHDELVSSTPAADATVAQPPSEVVLSFDEAVLPVGTQVVVTGPDGPASDGAPRLEGVTVHQPLRGGPAGKYSVAWRATSADGHPVSGTFAFTAQAASPPATTTSPATPTTSPPATTAPTGTPSTSPATTPGSSTSSSTLVAADPTGGSSSGFPWLAVVLVIVVVALAAAGWALSRRRTPTGPTSRTGQSSPTGPPGPTEPPGTGTA